MAKRIKEYRYYSSYRKNQNPVSLETALKLFSITKTTYHNWKHQVLYPCYVSVLLGHQDITTTQRRYAQFARPDLQEKAQAMDNVISFKKKKKNNSTQVNIASTEENEKEAINR